MFAKKIDAQRWLDELTADIVTGRYVDPRAGRVTLKEFSLQWLDSLTSDPLTRESLESRVRTHITPHLGSRKLVELRPSMIQAWVRGRQTEVAPSYCRLLLANLSTILSAAVDDALLASNPCSSRSVSAPAPLHRRVIPWSVERVQAVVEGHPVEYRAAPRVGGGCGLRQGEILGLDLDAVDFLRRKVHVRQQIRLVGGQLVFSPPKGGRERDVPLPDLVSVALAEHERRFPAVEVTLPWVEPGGPPHTSRLVFTNRTGGAITRAYYTHNAWRPGLAAAGVERGPQNGMHALRHHFASVLLDSGVSIAAVSKYLGHHDPGFTLATYAHMMPESEDRARTAIDAAHAALAGFSRDSAGANSKTPGRNHFR